MFLTAKIEGNLQNKERSFYEEDRSFYFPTDGHDWWALTSEDWLSDSSDVDDCDLTIRCSRNDEELYRKGMVAIT